ARLLPRVHPPPAGMIDPPLRHDPAAHRRCRPSQPRHHIRIERHGGNRAGISGEHRDGAGDEARVAFEPALELEHEGGARADQVAQIAERHHAVGGGAKRDLFELGRAQGGERAAALGEAAERVVVVHHGLAIAAELQVDLDAVAGGHRGRDRARGILDDAARRIVQAAVGDRPRGEPVGCSHGRERHFTSNMPSTSTAASSGSTATPTVVRACRPLSPNSDTIRSEAPFMTFGPSTNFGSELMKPPRRTTRVTFSRSPSAAFTWASTLMAQARAAFWPSSVETPAPSLPVATSLPSAPRQSWPETTSSRPVRTNPT